MPKENLNFTEQPISFKEKRKLIFTFSGVLVVGALIAAVTYYVVIYNSKELPIPVIIFLVLFYGVLLLILSVRFIHVFQKTKLVYEGIITDKQQDTTKFRKSQGHSRYYIALDEELIGNYHKKNELLSSIKPHYIILKPTLVGGFYECEEWMKIADKHHIKYWLTSALESNIGLNAICQFTVEKKLSMPQGLGTGQLFTNNIEMPLKVERGFIFMG